MSCLNVASADLVVLRALEDVAVTLFCLYFQKTRLGVMEVRETADEYLRDGHFESETISSCADAVERKWERLMKMAEQRRAVVFTSYNFYRASEQVLFFHFKSLPTFS